MAERTRGLILRGRSCGVNSPVIRTKARKHSKRKKPMVTLGTEQTEERPVAWNPDVHLARKIFPD